MPLGHRPPIPGAACMMSCAMSRCELECGCAEPDATDATEPSSFSMECEECEEREGRHWTEAINRFDEFEQFDQFAGTSGDMERTVTCTGSYPFVWKSVRVANRCEPLDVSTAQRLG